MIDRRNRGLLFILPFLFAGGAVLKAQMDPYFTAINYPVPRDTMMVMLLSDFQSARSSNDFFTGMGMVQRPHSQLDGGVHGGGAENLRFAYHLRRDADQ